MELKLKRVSFTDEWIVVGDYDLEKPYEFQNLVMGWRWEASPRELATIREQKMFNRRLFKLRPDELWFTFSVVLRPDFIPEVKNDVEELLRVEALLRKEVAIWNHWFAKQC